MQPSTHPFDKYKEYPNALFDVVKQALFSVGYKFDGKDDQTAYFKKDPKDMNETPLEVPNEKLISRLTIYQIADIHGLTKDDRFKIKLWSLLDSDGKA